MLSEADARTMREGRTLFVDKRQTGGVTFDKIVLSLHASERHALEELRGAGYEVPQLKCPEPLPEESRCAGCEGLMPTPSLFERRCIVCWAVEAKRGRLARN